MLATPCQAAIAYVNSATPIVSATGTSAAFNATSLTSGNLIVVIIRWSGASITVSSVTDTASNSYSQVVAQDLTGGINDHTAMWYAQGVTGNASNVVTINFSGSASAIYAVNAQYSGIATSSSLDTSTSAVANNSFVTSSSFSTNQADEVIVTGTGVSAGSGTNLTVTGTSGTYTRRSIDAANVVAIGDYIASSTQSSVTATWTDTTTDIIGLLLGAFKAPGGSTSKPRLLLLGVGDLRP